MLQENVEIVRRAIEQLMAEKLDVSMLAPDIVLDNSNAAFDGAVYRGYDGVREWLEFVLDAYARYNAGERRPELWFWHDDAEYHASSEDPDSEVHRGIDAIRKQVESWEEAYPDLKVEPLEAKENGDRVLLWVRFVGHGAGSGLPIDMELAHVLTLEEGRVRHLQEFTDRAEALEAVGLSE